MTKERMAAILGKDTSRRNKLALIADSLGCGDQVLYEWSGTPFNSRLLVAFVGSSQQWMECKSFDEDVLPKYKSGREKSR